MKIRQQNPLIMDECGSRLQNRDCGQKNLFYQIFWRTTVLLWGHWYPVFGLLVISSLGFKAKVDPLACILHHMCAMKSLDSPLVRHQLTSWRPRCFDYRTDETYQSHATGLPRLSPLHELPSHLVVTAQVRHHSGTGRQHRHRAVLIRLWTIGKMVMVHLHCGR